MRRRGDAAADVPRQLLCYRAAEWPSAGAWQAARRMWRREHPPASLDALNRFYGPSVAFPPAIDPRRPS